MYVRGTVFCKQYLIIIKFFWSSFQSTIIYDLYIFPTKFSVNGFISQRDFTEVLPSLTNKQKEC